jgi:hypothetical protein
MERAEESERSVIFINYRRNESAAATGRVHDWLRREFGQNGIFRDIDSIPLGEDFVEHIERAVRSCDVVLAIIGARWVTPRLADANDYVRIEIEAALKHGIPLVPVLVDDATMPTVDQLPPSLAPLLRRHGARIDSGIDFPTHFSRLVEGIKPILAEGARKRSSAQRVPSPRPAVPAIPTPFAKVPDATPALLTPAAPREAVQPQPIAGAPTGPPVALFGPRSDWAAAAWFIIPLIIVFLGPVILSTCH